MMLVVAIVILIVCWPIKLAIDLIDHISGIQ